MIVLCLVLAVDGNNSSGMCATLVVSRELFLVKAETPKNG